MLDVTHPWIEVFEEPPADDPLDVLTIPEIRRAVAESRPDGELGLRSLLERPELVFDVAI